MATYAYSGPTGQIVGFGLATTGDSYTAADGTEEDAFMKGNPEFKTVTGKAAAGAIILVPEVPNAAEADPVADAHAQVPTRTPAPPPPDAEPPPVDLE
jgi:hypothetical protein